MRTGWGMVLGGLAPLLAACTQILGIDDVKPGLNVPAIDGSYVVGLDVTATAALHTIIVFQTNVSYDEPSRSVHFSFQPLDAKTYAATGAPWSFDAPLMNGSSLQYTIDPFAGDVLAGASPPSISFSLDGTVAGEIRSDTRFCGVVTGQFWTVDPNQKMTLDNVEFGAVKAPNPTATKLEVDCQGHNPTTEYNCSNGHDDDGDNAVDCQDADCAHVPPCP